MKLSNQFTVAGAMILIYLFVTACSSLEKNTVAEIIVTSTAIPAVMFTATTRPTAIPTNTLVHEDSPTPEPSNTPIPIETPTRQPTLTATSMAAATSEPISTPISLLTIQQPSVEELEIYLTGIASDKFPFYSPFSENIELLYEDVSGDGQADLIISDFLLVGVFVWEGDHYREPLLYQGYPFKYDPGSRVYLEDWTNDGVPEIIFDYRDDTGGTGIVHTDWTRYVIQCTQKTDSSCKVIWGGKLAAFTEDYNAGGLDLLQTNVEHNVNDNGSVSLLTTTNFFAVYSWGWYLAPFTGEGTLFFSSGGEAEGLPENYRAESLNVYTSTLTTLTWDGQEFQWQDTKILKPAYRIDSQEKLEAISSEGKSAVISAEFNNAATLQNDSCQLFVDGAIVGTQFGCKKNFTVVNWQDVTNDDQAELVITTLSGIFDVDGRKLSNKRCVHQRLLIYQRINSQLAEIANVTGCVVQSDLYGVRTLDIDGDGQVEILAANRWLTGDPCSSAFSMISGSQPNCWYEFGHQDEIYKWNGSEFVYWGLLSE